MSAIDYKNELNQTQYEVVTSGEGPHLVLAGAGSGKTRTLVYRVAWLIENGVAPDRILLLTFTNKAAREMMDRVRELLKIPEGRKMPVWGGTFHSTANRLLRIYGKAIGLRKDFTIFDDEDRKTLIKNISKEIFKGVPAKSQPVPGILSETMSFAQNSEISLAESLEIKYPEWLPLLEQFEKIAAMYEKRKRAANVLDFDDLLLYWLGLSEDKKAGQTLRDKWDYILVDEYQDTNTLQAKIIANLVNEKNNLLVVGDDAQSIYSFRAANIQNILNFPEIFDDTNVHKLETNYRSTPEILEVANQIIAANVNQFAKELRAVVSSYTKPEMLALSNNLEEASFIANRIQGLMADGIEPREIAVLFRAAHHSQNLELELNKRGISYEMRGGLKFFARAHIKDVLAYVKVLGNHRDEVAWQRLLQLYPGIGPAGSQKISLQIGGLDSIDKVLQENFGLKGNSAKSWERVVELMERLVANKDKNLGKLLNFVIEDYEDYLKEKFTDYRQRGDDLEQLATFASGYDNLDDFLSEISLQENFSMGENSSDNNVILSTVHQAKGLEWSAVFIINMSNKAFPHPLCVSDAEREEERRLFYVAVTRAKQLLYLTYPMAEFKYDGYKTLKPSSFVRDIDPTLLNLNELARSIIHIDSDDGVEYVIDQDSVSEGDFLPDVDEW